MPEELLTVAQAASELGMEPASVRRAIIGGRLKAQKLSPRVVLIRRRDLERFKQTPKNPGGRPKVTAKEPEE